MSFYRMLQPDTERGTPGYTVFPLPLEHLNNMNMVFDILLGVAENAPCPEGAADFYRFYYDVGSAFLKSDGVPILTREAQKKLALNSASANPEDACGEALWQLITAADHFGYMYGSDIITVFREETMAALRGGITGEQAAAHIQNRVQLYLDEQG